MFVSGHIHFKYFYIEVMQIKKSPHPTPSPRGHHRLCSRCIPFLSIWHYFVFLNFQNIGISLYHAFYNLIFTQLLCFFN